MSSKNTIVIKGKIPSKITIAISIILFGIAFIAFSLSKNFFVLGVSMAISLLIIFSLNLHRAILTPKLIICIYGMLVLFKKGTFSHAQFTTDSEKLPCIKIYNNKGKSLYLYTEDKSILKQLNDTNLAVQTTPKATKSSNQQLIDTTDYARLFQSLQKNAICATFVDTPSFNKIGGTPDLPKDFEWPTYLSNQDNMLALTQKVRPLSFLMQINLADVKQFDKDNLLPNDGVLSVFYDNLSMPLGDNKHSQSGLRVFYFDKNTPLHPYYFDYPSEEWESDGEFYIAEQFLEFTSQTQLPICEECELLHHTQYPNYYQEYDEESYPQDPAQTHLLGYAQTIQGECLSKCASFLNKDADFSEYILLFQITSSYKTDTSFNLCDDGHLYVYIHKKDLEAMNFDKIAYAIDFA